MRGDDQQLQTGMFSYVALEDRIPADHPLRAVRKLVDAVLARMTKDFDGTGGPAFEIDDTVINVGGWPILSRFLRKGGVTGGGQRT